MIDTQMKPELVASLLRCAMVDWTSTTTMDLFIFDILLLLVVGASWNKSALLPQDNRGIAVKKLLYFIKDEPMAAQVTDSDPLYGYILRLAAREGMGDENNNDLEHETIRLELETSLIGIRAFDVESLYEGMKKLSMFEGGKFKLMAQVMTRMLLNDRPYTQAEVANISGNEFFLEKKCKMYVQALELEQDDVKEFRRVQAAAFAEVRTKNFINSYVRPEYQESFSAILHFRLSERMTNPRGVLVEALSGGNCKDNRQLGALADIDKLLFYTAALYLLTNLTCMPLHGRLVTLEDVNGILSGDAVKVQLPGVFGCPPLRRTQPNVRREWSGKNERNYRKRGATGTREDLEK